MGKKYNLCNFDEKEVYKLYSKIDKEYHKKSNCNEGLKDCTAVKNYTDWKERIIKDFCKKDPERLFFLHRLKKKLTNYRKFEEGLKAVVIPVYLIFVTIMLTPNSDMYFLKVGVVVVLLLVVILCSVQIKKIKDKILFYEECIDVVENTKASH